MIFLMMCLGSGLELGTWCALGPAHAEGCSGCRQRQTALRGVSFSVAAAVRSPGAFETGDQRVQPVQNVHAGESVHAAEGDYAET